MSNNLACTTLGFEADDVIATMAEVAGPNREVVVVSSDKDFLQLVTQSVVLVCPVQKKVYTPAEVMEKCGVHPHQVNDFNCCNRHLTVFILYSIS